MQRIPLIIQEALAKVFDELCDGRVEHFDREYRPAVDGPPRWFVRKKGAVIAEVTADWTLNDDGGLTYSIGVTPHATPAEKIVNTLRLFEKWEEEEDGKSTDS